MSEQNLQPSIPQNFPISHFPGGGGGKWEIGKFYFFYRGQRAEALRCSTVLHLRKTKTHPAFYRPKYKLIYDTYLRPNEWPLW